MERESFCDSDVAKLMNEHFVCIKVDREERPDVDDLYLSACMNMVGHAGWPLNLLLTPDQKPFFAGTYFPPQDSQGRPGWASLLTQLSQLWKERRAELSAQAEALMQKMHRQFTGSGRVISLEPELLDGAVSDLAQKFDAQWGGFGGAPKFAPIGECQLLLRYYHRSKDDRLLAMVARTLDAMASGGIRDHINGGFYRYAVDERWVVPHFEKMLSDNAQVARLYLEGYQATQQDNYRQVAVEILDYLVDDLCSSEGGFYTSKDAEVDGEEGKSYLWTTAEIEEVVGSDFAAPFCAYYDITPQGHFNGKCVPNVPRPLGPVAAQYGIKADDFLAQLLAAKAKLREHRRAKAAAKVDDKVVTAWNGMAIGALAEAYRVLGEERFLVAAKKAAHLIESQLMKDGKLLRTYRAGESKVSAFLDDYSLLGLGLLDLYEASGEENYLKLADKLSAQIVEQFIDEDEGFLDCNRDSQLVVGHRAIVDGPLPPPTASAALFLTRLSYLMDKPALKDKALAAIGVFGKELRRSPAAFCRTLLTVDYCMTGPLSIVIVANNAERSPLLNGLGMHYVPNRVIAWKLPTNSVSLPLLEGKEIAEQPTLHICQSGVCAQPVTAAKDLPAVLEELRGEARFQLYRRTPGRATPQATAAAADKHGNYRQIGNTGLQVSAVGFGTYRVEDETLEHENAVFDALDAGVNLIDTSSNYTDGASERLVGGIVRIGEKPRESLVIVSKLGYVQGQNLMIAQARIQMGQPYPDMVPFQESCWHCIHPVYLQEQLERSLMRLGLETLDFCLLHNPEYFLLEAAQKGRSDLAAVRHEFYARVEQAFAFLESAVEQGRISYYGVSSNSLSAPEDNPTATSFAEFLRVAQKVGGDNHHFRMVQLPMNLVECSAYPHLLRAAEDAQVGVVLNRPLNAFFKNNLVRLADFELEEQEPQFVKNVAALAAIENEFRATFGKNIQGEGTDQLFRFAENLRPLDGALMNIEHWNQLEMTRIRPTLQDQIGALDQAIQGPASVPWSQWREKFLAQFRECMNDLEQMALEKSQELADSVRETFIELVPERHKEATTSRLATWILASTPGVTSVLVGMRSQDYVEDICEVLSWDRLAEVEKIYAATSTWSLPGDSQGSDEENVA